MYSNNVKLAGRGASSHSNGLCCKSTKRKRGTHSTCCLNPKPVYVRPASWKNLPGELGKTFNFCRKRDISRDPHFVHLRQAAGRQRDFKDVRRNLINPMFQMLLSRHDLATGIVELDLEDMAAELSKMWVTDPETGEQYITESKVTVSRISRFIDEVMIPFGLCYVHADGDEANPKSGMVWDQANGFWFPKVLVLTNEFYRLAGADLDKLYTQADEQLALRNSGLTEAGEVITLREARNRKRKQIFKRAWDARKQNAGAQRRRNKLASKSLDERKHEVATALTKSMPAHELAQLSSEQFNKLVWERLNSMDIGISHPPPDTIQ
ncbi:plasmid replication initiator RepA [Vibrio mimicus]|uniref:plasmid replication initiator RepA n=1 Tax=Vibrio mimicus TaxID=674 RepID=UPI0021CC1662|nr:plasmid replication initiator RepA [Vibrio mimicus]